MLVVFLTHSGLSNQLFQILQAKVDDAPRKNRTLPFKASLQSAYRHPELRKMRQCYVDALKF